MEESLGKSLGTFLDERLSNPVIGTFILSWCGWNYKFFVALFSNNTVTETLRIIDKVIYPDWTSRALQGVALPIVSVILYFGLVPIITKKYYDWTAKTRKALDEAKYEAEKHKRLSAAESAELQDTVRRTRSELDLETTKVENLRSELRNAADKDKERLDALAKFQADLDAAIADANQLRNTFADEAAAEAKIRKERNAKKLIEAFRIAKGLPERERIALTALANSNTGSIAAAATDLEIPDLTRTEASEALTALAEKQLAQAVLNDQRGLVYNITPTGVESLMNLEALNAVSDLTSKRFDVPGPLNPAQIMQVARDLSDIKARILELAARSQAGSVSRSSVEVNLPGYHDKQVTTALNQMANRKYIEIRHDIPGGAVVITSLGKEIYKARQVVDRQRG